MTANYLPEAERRAQILAAALAHAKREGYQNVTRAAICDQLEISHSLVNRYFGDVAGLRSAVMREAIKTRVLCVVAQGLVMKDRQARRAPAELRAAAIESMK